MAQIPANIGENMGGKLPLPTLIDRMPSIVAEC